MRRYLCLLLTILICIAAAVPSVMADEDGKLKEVQVKDLDFKQRDYYFPFVWWDVESDKGEKRFVWTGLSFFHYRTPEKKFDMFFPFGFRATNKEKQSTLKGALGLWWKYESPNKDVHVAGPWISFNKSDRGFEERFRGLIPFFAVYSSEKGSWKNILLFFHMSYNRERDNRRYMFFPFYFQSSSESHGTHQSAFFPLWYYSREGQQRKQVFTPVGFYRKTETGRRLLLFNTYISSRPDDRMVSFFPLYWGRSVDRPGFRRKEHLVVPLWYSSTEEFQVAEGKDKGRIISRKRNVLLPLWYYSGTDSGQKTLITPLAFYRRDRDTTNLILLNFYRKRTPTSSVNAFFPLYFSSLSGDERLRTFLPLFFYKRDAEKKDLVLPGAWLRFYREGGGKGFAGPVYWNTGGNRRSIGLFPVAGYFSNLEKGTSTSYILNWFRRTTSESDLSVFFPIFYHRVNQKKGELTSGLVPLYFHRRTPAGSDTLTPVSWVRRYREGGSRGFTGPAYWNTSGEMFSWGFFPLGGSFTNRETGAFRRYVLNTYWSRSREQSVTVFFPLFLHSEDYRRGSEFTLAAPFYFRYANREHSDSFTPLSWVRTFKKGGSRGVILPYYWDTSEGRKNWILFPAAGRFRNTKAGTDRGFVLNTIWWKTPEERAALFFPLAFFARNQSKGTSTSIVLPFVYHRVGTNASDTVTPLSWVRNFNDGTSRGIIGPFYWDSSAGNRHWLFFPLAGSFRDREHGFGWGYMLNLLWQRTPEADRTMFFPFYFHSRNKAANVDQKLLLPLLYTRKTPEVEDRVTPVSWVREYRTGESTGFAGPVFWNTRGSTKVAGLLPIAFSMENSKKGTETAYVLNYFRRKTPDSEFSTVFPLYFSHVSNKGQNVTRGGVFGFHRRTPGSETTFVLPGWFSRKTQAMEFQTFFPLAWRYANKKSGRSWSTLLPPVYFRYGNEKTGVQVRQAMLAWWAIDTENTRIRILPPYFGMDTKEGTRIRSLFPLWWSFGDKEARNQILFPLYYRRIGDDSYLHVTPLFFKGRYGNTHSFGMPLGPIAQLAKTGALSLSWGSFFPFYAKFGSSETDFQFFTLAPFFAWWREKDTRTAVLPIGFVRKTPESYHWLILNSYKWGGKQRKFYGFFPLWWGTASETEGTRTDFCIPLWFFRSNPQGRLLITPVGYHRKKGDTAHEIFPFYFGYSSPKRKIRFFYPAYLHHETPRYTDDASPLFWVRSYREGGSRGFAGPVYWKTDGASESGGLFPIMGNYRNTQTGAYRGYFLNTLWSSTPEEKTVSFLPLFYHNTNLKEETTTSLLLPLYFFRGDTERKDLVTPVSWMRTYAEGGSRGFAGPLYWNTSGKSRSFGLFPVGGHFRNIEQGRMTEYFLTYFRHRSKTRSVSAFLPLFFHTENLKTGADTSFLLPLYFSRARDGRRDTFTPLSWVRRTDSGTRGFIGPMFWKQTDKVRHQVFFPLAGSFTDLENGDSRKFILNTYWSTSDRGTLETFFPLYFRKTDARKQTATTAVLPLFYRHATPEQRDTFTPISWIRTRRDGSSAGIVGPVYWSRGGENQVRGLFPVAGEFTSEHGSRKYLLNMYSSSSSEGSFETFFPLYFKKYNASTGAETTALAPLFYHRTAPGETVTVTPAFFRRDTPERTDTVTPLSWVMTGPDGQTSGFTGPVYWNLTGSRRDWGIFPLWGTYADRETGAYRRHLLTAYWSGSDKGSLAFLFPLYFRKTDREKETAQSGLLPFYYRSADANRRDTFTPVSWVRTYAEGGSRGFVGPAYWGNTAGKKSFGLFPVGGVFTDRDADSYRGYLLNTYWSRSDKGSLMTFFPLFFRWEDTSAGSALTGLFPLFYRSADSEKRDTFTPVSWIRTYAEGGSRGFVGPVFWKNTGRKKTFGLVPVAGFSSDSGAGTNRGYILNTYWSRSKTRKRYGFFPLFYHRSDTGDNTVRSYAFPVYYYSRNRKFSDSVSPFTLSWIRSYSSGGSKGVVGPAYWNTSGGRKSWGFFPIIGSYGSGDGTRRHGYVLNVYWKNSPEVRSAGFFPLFFYHADRTAETAVSSLIPLYFYHRDSQASQIFTPLFWAKKYKSGGSQGILPFVYWKTAQGRKDWWFFPLTGSFADTAAGESFSYFLNMYRIRKPGESSFGMFPLFHSHSTKGAGGDMSYLLPLYFYRSSLKSSHLVTPLSWVQRFRRGGSRGFVGPVYWRNTPDKKWVGFFPVAGYFRDRIANTKRGYVLNTYWSESDKGKLAVFFPLYFSKENRDEHTKTSGLLPVFFYRQDPEKTDVITPLSWVRTHTGGGSTGVIPPVYWNTANQKRTWGIFPLINYSRDLRNNNLTAHFLLYFRQRSQSSDFITFAPIYFSKKTPGYSFRFLLPFYWDYENNKSHFASRIVFPLYWRFTGKTGTVTKVVPPVWWRYNEKRQMLANGLPLLWHYEREGREMKFFSVFARMFGYERAGLKRRMYFLWIPINLSPLERLEPAQ